MKKIVSLVLVFSLFFSLSGCKPKMEKFTDSCSVFLAAGERVFLVNGDRNNIKLTYPEDMERAENIIKCKEEK